MKLTIVEWFADPLMPVIVNWNVPCLCWLLTVKIRFEVPDPVTDVGENVPVTREGNPATLRFTVPENPA